MLRESAASSVIASPNGIINIKHQYLRTCRKSAEASYGGTALAFVDLKLVPFVASLQNDLFRILYFGLGKPAILTSFSKFRQTLFGWPLIGLYRVL